MNKYIITLESELNLTDIEKLKLSEKNISDVIVCVRDKQGGSFIIKPNVEIKIKKVRNN